MNPKEGKLYWMEEDGRYVYQGSVGQQHLFHHLRTQFQNDCLCFEHRNPLVRACYQGHHADQKAFLCLVPVSALCIKKIDMSFTNQFRRAGYSEIELASKFAKNAGLDSRLTTWQLVC